MDGSPHRWFQDRRSHDLPVVIDDATSEIYYAQRVEEESTRTVMKGLREVIAQRAFSAPYTAIAAAISFTLPRPERR